MTLSVQNGPQQEPLTLAAAKSHLHVTWSDDDSDIEMFVAAARSAIEAYVQGPILETEYLWSMDLFLPELVFPVGPVTDKENVSIRYVDLKGEIQELDQAVYDVSTGQRSRVRPAPGQIWPQVRPRMDAVMVTFTAGYHSVSDVEPAILAALKMTVSNFYEYRTTGGLPAGAQHLLTSFIRF